MRKAIALIMAFALMAASFSTSAEIYDGYVGVYPYDTTGMVRQEYLDKLAKANETIYDLVGLRIVSYIVPSCGNLSAEEYAGIVWNIRASMLEDMENEMLVLMDAENHELYVKKGASFEAFFSEDEVNACLEKATSSTPPNGLQYLFDFYAGAITAISSHASQGSVDSARNEPNGDSLDDLLAEQPLAAVEPQFVVQSSEYKALYPDQLRAVLVNNSQDDIRDAVVTFMGWDENGLPVFITMQMDFNPNVYDKKASYKGINLVPGTTRNISIDLNEKVGVVATVKVIAMSYETFDGKTWTNPYYDEYIEKYAGKKLPED